MPPPLRGRPSALAVTSRLMVADPTWTTRVAAMLQVARGRHQARCRAHCGYPRSRIYITQDGTGYKSRISTCPMRRTAAARQWPRSRRAASTSWSTTRPPSSRSAPPSPSRPESCAWPSDGVLITPEHSAAALLAHLAGDDTGAIWHVSVAPVRTLAPANAAGDGRVPRHRQRPRNRIYLTAMTSTGLMEGSLASSSPAALPSASASGPAMCAWRPFSLAKVSKIP
jgi:hypothetical protein